MRRRRISRPASPDISRGAQRRISHAATRHISHAKRISLSCAAGAIHARSAIHAVRQFMQRSCNSCRVSGNSCADRHNSCRQAIHAPQAHFPSGFAGHIARREAPYIACSEAAYIAREAYIAFMRRRRNSCRAAAIHAGVACNSCNEVAIHATQLQFMPRSGNSCRHSLQFMQRSCNSCVKRKSFFTQRCLCQCVSLIAGRTLPLRETDRPLREDLNIPLLFQLAASAANFTCERT